MKFSEYLAEDFQELYEKLLLINNGAKYGQVVFLAGGSGSGKDFAIEHFMEGDKFKIVDPDKILEIFLKLERKRGGPFKDIDLTNPDDVTKVWEYVKHERGWKHKVMDMLFSNLNPGSLPNIIFNTTLSWADSLGVYANRMKDLGYESENIHIIWVLTNYKLAVERNKSRSRVVDADVLFSSHVGAAKNLTSLLLEKNITRHINGGAYVILNNFENTVVWTDSEDSQKSKESSAKKFKHLQVKKPDDKNLVIKDFKYLTLKKPGRPMENKQQLVNDLKTWIKDNVPDEAKGLAESLENDIKKKFNRSVTFEKIIPGKYETVHNFKFGNPADKLSVDLVFDITDVYADAIFKQDGKQIVAQTQVLAHNPKGWISTLNKDKAFIEFLKELAKDER
jgi:hypothetical protein